MLQRTVDQHARVCVLQHVLIHVMVAQDVPISAQVVEHAQMLVILHAKANVVVAVLVLVVLRHALDAVLHVLVNVKDVRMDVDLNVLVVVVQDALEIVETLVKVHRFLMYPVMEIV